MRRHCRDSGETRDYRGLRRQASDKFCGRLPSLTQVARGAAARERREPAQQPYQGLGHPCGGKAFKQACGDLPSLDGRHEISAAKRPEWCRHKLRAPPCSPSRDRRAWYAQSIELTHCRGRAGASSRSADNDHDRGDIHAPAEKAHRERRGTPSTCGTAEAVAEIAVRAGFTGKSAGFAGIAGAMQYAAAMETTLRAGLAGEILIDV